MPVPEWHVVKQLAKTGHSSVLVVKKKRSTDRSLYILKKGMDSDAVSGLRKERDILVDYLRGHRNIVSLANPSISEVGGLLLGYCPGGDLNKYIADFTSVGASLDRTTVMHIFIQMVHALAYIHHGNQSVTDPREARHWKPVIHRDIKPMNIFLSDHRTRPRLILGDFDFATTRPVSETYSTEWWQGPELPLCTAQGDVWSIGVILHQLLHNGRDVISKPPRFFRGSSRDWARQPEARKALNAPSHYGKDLDHALVSCLRWKWRDRPTSLQLAREYRVLWDDRRW